MLPTGSRYAGSLTEVVPSSLAAIGVQGFTNSLALPDSKSVVIVLVDGLGHHNLRDAAGHARFLSRDTHVRRELVTVFPSTTAAALVSLMTGESPSIHGIAGYKLRDPQSGRMVNQLTELDAVSNEWMRCATLAENVSASASAEVFVVGRSKFANSPMTRTAYRGATYVSADTLDERVNRTSELAKIPGRLVMLYISELDSTAHKFGVESNQWREGLEEVDGALKSLRESVPRGVSVLVTADHGVVDVDATRHVVLDDEHLMGSVVAVGGEPRCVQLYFDDVGPNMNHDDRAKKWQENLDGDIVVATRNEVIASGVLGETHIDDDVAHRLGELFLFTTKPVVVYDGRDENRAPRRMVGQHGALTEREMIIPLIQLT